MKKKFVLPVVANTEMSEVEKKDFFAEMARMGQRKKDEIAKPSPYHVHRDNIFGGYGTSIRLQDLILHLYNSENKCDLGALLANADEEHMELAIEIIRRYSILVENDQDFMRTAREILTRRAAA